VSAREAIAPRPGLTRHCASAPLLPIVLPLPRCTIQPARSVHWSAAAGSSLHLQPGLWVIVVWSSLACGDVTHVSPVPVSVASDLASVALQRRTEEKKIWWERAPESVADCQGTALRCNEMKNVFLDANGAADGRRVTRFAERVRLAPFSLFQKPRLLLRALRSVQAPRSPKIVLHQCYGSRTRNGEQMTGRGEKRVNKDRSMDLALLSDLAFVALQRRTEEKKIW